MGKPLARGGRLCRAAQELVFDGTAILAAELLAASLHGMLTNGSTSWFGLRFSDDELNGDDEAKEWLQSVEDVMYQAFNRSNFQEQIAELYLDLVTFGTAVMFVDKDDEQHVTSKSAFCPRMTRGGLIRSFVNLKCRHGLH